MLAGLPGEFEKQSAILLGCNELLPEHPRALVEIIGALIERLPVIVMIGGEDLRGQVITTLCDWGVPTHLLRYVAVPMGGMWARDCGPSFVRREGPRLEIVQAGGSNGASDLSGAPEALSELLKLPIRRVPLMLDGGCLLSNGAGLYVTTRRLIEANERRGYGQAQVEATLRQEYGMERLVVLQPLENEPTGHIDLFAAFAAENVLVLGQYDRRVDPINADVLEANARRLARVRPGTGALKVVRMPMPTNGGGLWHTYTSVVFANGRLLVQRYPFLDGDCERKAMKLWADLLRGWQVMGVDASTLVRQHGSIRGICINIPCAGEGAGPTFRL